MIDAPRMLSIFDAHSKPHVSRRAERGRQGLEPLGSLRQHLELVLRALAHYFEHSSDVRGWHILVKEVRHAVHEQKPSATPAPW